MKITPALAQHITVEKPSSYLASRETISRLALLRDQFTVGTWLLLGALLQSALLVLPIRKSYAVAPAILLLGFQFVDHLLMAFGVKKNVYMDRVVPGRVTALVPEKDGSFERKSLSEGPGGDSVVVFLLAARANHPLGLLAPRFKELNEYYTKMNHTLEANAEKFGYLGGSSWLNMNERTTGSEILTIFYFRTIEHLQGFAHSEEHLKGWDWWNKTVKQNQHLSISHEMWSVPAGNWENVYINYHPAGFGATAHRITDKDGQKKWASPIVNARTGLLRSARGRLGLSETESEKKQYKDTPLTDE